MKKQKITYSQVGDNYDTKDPIKILAQTAAKKTGQNLLRHGFCEISETRGESAYVWKQGNIHMASVIEGLGTKNLIADEMRKITGKTYYDVIGHDTVATIINDLISVGAKPLVLHMYLAIENNDWLLDNARMSDLIQGFSSACNLAGASWGGGETPTLKGIIVPDTIELGGAAIGIISDERKLVIDAKMREGDRILLLKSNGINTNGISLARAVSRNLKNGYAAKLKNGVLYGDALLKKTNIYAKLIQDLLDNNIDIHYLSNITGHGLRKVMRAKRGFSYILEKIFEPQELFAFLQDHAGLTEKEMYETYNMGMDYAIFLPKKELERAQKIISQDGFESVNAGYISAGKRQVIIESKNIILEGESLQLKA